MNAECSQNTDDFMMTSFTDEMSTQKMSLRRSQTQGFSKVAMKISWSSKTQLQSVKSWLTWMVLLPSVILQSNQISISRKFLLQTIVLLISKIILAIASDKNYIQLSGVSRLLIGAEDSKCLWRTGPSDSIIYIFTFPYLFLNTCDYLSFIYSAFHSSASSTKQLSSFPTQIKHQC